ncbi:hypothetical protein SPKIRA_37320 (plasmid) [Sphingomonas paucimobilis]|nr:hypothetical protein SPKIRA_37320 [Sphingomonas paucimobilis]
MGDMDTVGARVFNSQPGDAAVVCTEEHCARSRKPLGSPIGIDAYVRDAETRCGDDQPAMRQLSATFCASARQPDVA